MPFSAPHKLVTVRGRCFGSTEQWSFGMRFGDATFPTQAMADSAAAVVKTWWTLTTSGYPNSFSLDSVKVAPIGIDGRYPASGISYESFAGLPAAGGNTSNGGQIPQAALVISLLTPVPRGRGHIGRCFLPAPGYPLNVTGGISSAQATALLGNFRNMVLGLEGITNMGPLGVWSKFQTSNQVTGFRCGLVYDTMRSRRRSIPENPVFLAK